MVSVGLFALDSRIYYLDADYAVLDNPYDGCCPTIVKRTHGTFDTKEVKRILSELKLELDGDSFHRSDGLICNKLKESERWKKELERRQSRSNRRTLP